MTRPRKKEDARARRLIVRINDEEQARIRAEAREAGLPVSEYVRRASVEGRVTVRRESAYGMSLASQLRRIGNLLNQLTRLAHIDGELPPELPALWRKLDVLLDRVIRAGDVERR